jgi:hypothetical protein
MCRILNFWEVVALGKKSANNNMADVDVEAVPPTPDSPCIIMYTSGIPKETVSRDDVEAVPPTPDSPCISMCTP